MLVDSIMTCVCRLLAIRLNTLEQNYEKSLARKRVWCEDHKKIKAKAHEAKAHEAIVRLRRRRLKQEARIAKKRAERAKRYEEACGNRKEGDKIKKGLLPPFKK